MTKLRSTGTALAVAALLAGCSLAPVYERPAAPVAADWRDAAAVRQANGQASGQTGGQTGGQTEGRTPGAAAELAAPDIGWREFYTEPALQKLIAQALEHNRDLRIAILNIEAARAQFGIRRADRLPTIGASASGTRQRVPADLSGAGQAVLAEQYDVGVGVTAFELDLFGRVRNLSDAALAEFLATAEARRATQISLVGQVAGTWLAVHGADEQAALLASTLEARENSLELIRLRYQGGAASELELRQAESLVEGTRADLSEAERVRLQARNALELLIGQPLSDDEYSRKTFAQVQLPADPPVGLPSGLLVRRPDIAAAEARLRGANADIGAARAAFFPRITLTGALGTASGELSGLFRGGSGVWSFMPQLSLPIFDGGRNRANLELAEVRRDLAVAIYEQGIQQAFREVADALSARSTIDERLRAQQAQVDAAARTLELSEMRYRSGIDSQLQWLEAQRTFLAAQQGLLAARLARVGNLIELYKSLGGGWLEHSVSAS